MAKPGEILGSVLAASSREIAARHSLEHAATTPQGRELTWMYLHVILETARHAGHADILRELIDGTVGD